MGPKLTGPLGEEENLFPLPGIKLRLLGYSIPITFRCDIPVVFYNLNTKYITSSRKQQNLLYCFVQYVTRLHVSTLF